MGFRTTMPSKKKFDVKNLEVGGSYAVKYLREREPIRVTYIGVKKTSTGTRFLFDDGTAFRNGLKVIGVTSRSVLGPADDVFQAFHEKEELIRADAQKRFEVQNELNKKRTDTLKALAKIKPLRFEDLTPRRNSDPRAFCLDIHVDDLLEITAELLKLREMERDAHDMVINFAKGL